MNACHGHLPIAFLALLLVTERFLQLDEHREDLAGQHLSVVLHPHSFAEICELLRRDHFLAVADLVEKITRLPGSFLLFLTRLLLIFNAFDVKLAFFEPLDEIHQLVFELCRVFVEHVIVFVLPQEVVVEQIILIRHGFGRIEVSRPHQEFVLG